MFGRKTEADKRFDSAKVDLARAKAQASAIGAREDEALGDAATYAAWRAESDAAAAEVGRQERLMSLLTTGVEVARQHEADSADRKRVEAARKLNSELAQRMQTEGVPLAAQLKALVRDVAAACVEADAVNKLRPPDVDVVLTADFLARGAPAVPRKDIEEKTLSLWVREDNGKLIGNQDEVVATGAGTGTLLVDKRFKIPCVKRKYKSVSYNPHEDAETPSPLHSMVRLPNFDGRGLAFDGPVTVIEHAATMNLDPPKAAKKPRRQVRTELVPLEPPPTPRTSELQNELAKIHEARS